MYRIDSSTAVVALPAPDAAAAGGFFENAPAGSGKTPTVLTSAWANQLQEEIIHVVIAAGLAPSKTDNTQLYQAINSMIAAVTALAAAAAADIWAGTDNTKFLTSLAVKIAQGLQALTDASTVAWNMNSGFNAAVTMAGNRLIGQPTNLQAGATVVLALGQDATGGRVPSWNGCWDFGAAGAPSVSAGANKVDYVFGFVADAATPKIKSSFWKAA